MNQDGPGGASLLPEPRSEPADDLAAVLHQAGRTAFGAAAVATEIVLRGLAESAPARQTGSANGAVQARVVADVVLGVGWRAAHVADRATGRALRVLSPVLSVGLAPPLVPRRMQPGHLLRQASLRWNQDRGGTVRSLSEWSASAVPVASDVVINLVDLDTVVAGVLARMDLQRLAETVVGRLDLDDLVTSAVDQVDVPALLEHVLARHDLNPMVEDLVRQMDLSEVVRLALDQIDLTALVLDRVDLQRVVAAVLDSMDLTELVLDRVDLVRIVDAVLAEIDLPEIIRESTGSIAADSVREVRIRGVDADRAVTRVMDRILPRRKDVQP